MFWRRTFCSLSLLLSFLLGEGAIFLHDIERSKIGPKHGANRLEMPELGVEPGPWWYPLGRTQLHWIVLIRRCSGRFQRWALTHCILCTNLWEVTSSNLSYKDIWTAEDFWHVTGMHSSERCQAGGSIEPWPWYSKSGEDIWQNSLTFWSRRFLVSSKQSEEAIWGRWTVTLLVSSM